MSNQCANTTGVNLSSAEFACDVKKMDTKILIWINMRCNLSDVNLSDVTHGRQTNFRIIYLRILNSRMYNLVAPYSPFSDSEGSANLPPTRF